MTYIGSLSGSQNSASSSSNPLSTLLGGSGISGLASGINTDAVVQGLVQAAQVPLVNLMQQRQVLQWKEQQYQQVNQSLSSLQDAVSSLQMQSTFMTKTVSSSNSAVVTGSASTLSAAGTYNVAVQQLAQGATIASSTSLSTRSNFGTTLLSALGVTGTSVTLQVNGGSTFTFDPTKNTVNDVLTAISQDTSSGVNAFYDPNSGKVVMQTTATGSSAKIQVNQDSGNLLSSVFKMTTAPAVESTAFQNGALTSDATFEINGAKFSYKAGTTVNTIASDITNSNVGVVASVDNTNNQLLLQGSNLYSPISVSNPNDVTDTATALGFSAKSSTTNTASHDAYFTVNGFPTTSQSNSAQFAGLTFNLLGTTAGSSPVSVTVSNNVDQMVQTIENFVKQYNTTLQVMQGLYYQQSQNNYQPLTTQQASQMTQSQIDQWNQKAQSGLLNSDTLLGSAMSGMENAVSTMVKGQPLSTVNGQAVHFQSLSDIGIQPYNPVSGIDTGYSAPGVTTSGWNTYGLLEVNDTQLRSALESDPQAVMRMFTNNPTPDPATGKADPSQVGVAVQMYSSLTSSITSITQEAGTPLGTPPAVGSILPYTAIDPNANLTTLFSSDGLDTSFLGGQITGLDQQSTDMQQQISDLRTRYQNEFSAMEQAMSQLSTQSSALSGMMGGSTGSSTGG